MNNEILVIDDNSDIRLLITSILKDNGFSVRQAANYDQAILEFQKKLPDVAIIDVKLDNNTAFFFIELTSADGRMYGFKWTLKIVKVDGPYKNCWMTTSVSTPMPLSADS